MSRLMRVTEDLMAYIERVGARWVNRNRRQKFFVLMRELQQVIVRNVERAKLQFAAVLIVNFVLRQYHGRAQ